VERTSASQSNREGGVHLGLRAAVEMISMSMLLIGTGDYSKDGKPVPGHALASVVETSAGSSLTF